MQSFEKNQHLNIKGYQEFLKNRIKWFGTENNAKVETIKWINFL